MHHSGAQTTLQTSVSHARFGQTVFWVSSVMRAWQVGTDPGAPFIVQAATSTTHPQAYYQLFEGHVLPFWQAQPPRQRLTKKPYKSIHDRNAVLREDSLTFQVCNSELWTVTMADGIDV